LSLDVRYFCGQCPNKTYAFVSVVFRLCLVRVDCELIYSAASTVMDPFDVFS